MKFQLNLLLLLFIFPFASSSAVIDQIDAVVNGQLILASEVDDQIAINIREEKFMSLSPQQREQLRRQVLQSLVEKMLIVQDLKSRLPSEAMDKIQKQVDGMTEQQIEQFKNQFGSPEEMVREEERVGMTWEEIKDYRLKTNKRDYIAEVVFSQFIAARTQKPTQKEIEQFQNDFPDYRPNEIKIAHILIRVPQEASPTEEQKAKDRIQDIYTQAISGQDFGELARQYSDDTQTAERGGILPPFKKGELFKQFNVAFDLKENQISKPIRTIRGFHILKVLEKKSMANIVYEYKVREKMKEYMEKLRSNAEIEIKQKSSPTLEETP